VFNKISVVIVDTMSVFHSLKSPNTNKKEIDLMDKFTNLSPRGYMNSVKVFMPKLSEELAKKSGYEIFSDRYLQLPLKEVELHDWFDLFNIKPTESTGILLSKAVNKLIVDEEDFGFSDLYENIEGETGFDESIKTGLIEMLRNIEKLDIFSDEGTNIKDIVKGGQISVLDISALGRVGGYDIRSLIVSIIGKRLLFERTVYSTVEMQSEANLIDDEISKDITKEHPLVYMLVDEAHLFLPSEGKTFSSEVLIDWIKLGRHPGLSVILATQEPSALHPTAIRQADLIIAHNITAQDDIQALGKARQTYMSKSEGIEVMVSKMKPIRGLSIIFDDALRTKKYCLVRPRTSIHTGLDASAIRKSNKKTVKKGSRGIKIFKK